MARASAKAILLGEHAVVYGIPAVAVPITARTTEVRIARDAPGVLTVHDERGVDTALAQRMVRKALELAYRTIDDVGMKVTIRSTIPLGAGLGSSAALAVAIARAVRGEDSTYIPTQVAGEANELEKLAHGTPSGIDATTIAMGRPILFRKDAPPEQVILKRPLPLVIGVLPREGTTASLVAGVRAVRDRDPVAFEKILGRVKEAVHGALTCLVEGEHAEGLALAIERNQGALRDMGVVTPAVSKACQAAVRAGALAAKVSGAGGGGVVLALLGPESSAEKVIAALRDAGATDAFATEVPAT